MFFFLTLMFLSVKMLVQFSSLIESYYLNYTKKSVSHTF